MAAISQAQAVKGVVMKDGINAGGKNVSNGEIAVLDSAKVGVPIQRQIDQKVGVASIVDYSATIYSKTDVDSIFKNAWVKVDGGITTRITHTGTTNETTLHTMTFPSARLGVNGRIWIRGIFDSTTGDGYTKNIYIKVNGTAVATFSAVTSTLIYTDVEVICRNSVSNKIIAAGQLNTTINADAPTATIDTSTGTVTITITCSLSNAGASTYIDAFNVQTMY